MNICEKFSAILGCCHPLHSLSFWHIKVFLGLRITCSVRTLTLWIFSFYHFLKHLCACMYTHALVHKWSVEDTPSNRSVVAMMDL